MATACEFTSGLAVLERFNMEDYRFDHAPLGNGLPPEAISRCL